MNCEMTQPQPPDPTLIVENTRLRELVFIVDANAPYFREVEAFLKTEGYASIHAFVNEPRRQKAEKVLRKYFQAVFTSVLRDGIGQPYNPKTAKWYFAAWLFRDAPAQRLTPLLRAVSGGTREAKQVTLLNLIREATRTIFPKEESWTWAAVSEVMLARLEGSRRALRGGQFEKTVRQMLTDITSRNGIAVTVTSTQVKLFDETYDVEVVGKNGKILIPVKTRETMGGGHASLFTRDIHKAVAVAGTNGFICIPVVIAESWGGDLSSLPCPAHIHIALNPNRTAEIESQLKQQLESHLDVFRAIS